MSPSRLLPRAEQWAPAAVLLLPLVLLHVKVAAEALVALLDLGFLLRCLLRHRWQWLRRGWVPVGGAWWLWLLFCSVPGIGIGGWPSLLQAIAAVRFLLLVAALEQWLLCESRWQRRLQAMLTASALYIDLNCALQLVAGVNMWGLPRFADGSLSGPFAKPRAGAPASRLLFPVLLPPVSRLLARHRPSATLGAAALAIGGVGTIVLIGQRMPLLLTLLGMVLSGLLLPRLRRLLLVCLVAGAALLAATPVISPPTWHRLVTKFTYQMEIFPDTDYGLLYARAAVITLRHPLFGRGFDGFRNACPDMHNWIAFPAAKLNFWDGGGASICNIHPHNHYLQAATDAGLPGLVLFVALVAAWVRSLARGLWSKPEPLRVGLLIAVVLELWPIASTSGSYDIDIMGFMYLMLGFGLALAPARQSPP